MDQDLFIKKRKHFLAFVVISSFFILFVVIISIPPKNILEHKVTVKSGDTISSVALSLEEAGVIKSKSVLIAIMTILNAQNRMLPGNYLFTKPSFIWNVAYRMTFGHFGVDRIKITIPEGSSVEEISKIISSQIKDFDSNEFLNLAKEKEGYLFPETYFFFDNTLANDVIKIMNETFYSQISVLMEDIRNSGKSIEDVITMASILEEEAVSFEDRRIVAGILWKRISIDMPLQVDATFQKINGKASLELTKNDLKIDSLYNTYKYKGLPPAPIVSPGLDSIKASINPIESDYLFYLSDKNGKIHYAKTFDEHKNNKRLYL